MKNQEDEIRQLRRPTFQNFCIIAAIITCSGLIIGTQTHQLGLIGKITAFLLVAGFVCIPIVHRRAQQRLAQFGQCADRETDNILSRSSAEGQAKNLNNNHPAIILEGYDNYKCLGSEDNLVVGLES